MLSVRQYFKNKFNIILQFAPWPPIIPFPQTRVPALMCCTSLNLLTSLSESGNCTLFICLRCCAISS